MEHVKRIFGNSKIMTALTLNDLFTWSAGQLVAIIFVLFALEHIDGATTTQIGLATMVYMGVAGAFNMPFGKLLDKKKGYLDESVALTISTFIRGTALIALAFSTQLWQMYALQVVLGISTSLNYIAWRALFTHYMDNKHPGEEWGAYQTLMSIGYAIAAGVGGFLGDHIEFKYILALAGVVTIVGSLVPLLVMDEVKKKK